MLMRFMGVAELLLGDTVWEKNIRSSDFAPSSVMILKPKGWEHFAVVFIGTALYKSAYWSVVFFCNVLGLLQREVSLMIGKDCMYRLYSGGGH